VNDRRVRWAVVGTSDFALDWVAGGIAHSPDAELVAVIGRDPVRAEAAAARMGASRSATSIEELDPTDVDVVDLVVPNPQHAPLTIAALERGFHVVVEKPMAPTLAECRAMAEAARRCGRRLFVAHCMTWRPPVVAIRAALADGRVGQPVMATVSIAFDGRPNGSWRQELTTEASGGPLYDLGAHAIDALLSMFGRVGSVTGRLDRIFYTYPADDTAIATLRFVSGVVGVVETSFACEQNDFVVNGRLGRMSSSEWLGRDTAGDAWWRPARDSLGRQAPPEVIPLEPRNVYEAQATEVSQALLENRPSAIPADRGMAVVAVIEATIRSARNGGAVVVPEAP